MEQDTRFELVTAVWKTAMLTNYTNPAFMVCVIGLEPMT